MLERILILFLFLILTYFFIRRFNFKEVNSGQVLPISLFNHAFSEIRQLPDVGRLNPLLPTILYFSTEQCTQCKSTQAPALLKLQDGGKQFNLVSLNALKEIELTKYLNIKTVPATAVLSHDKKLHFLNNGYASDILLNKQLMNLPIAQEEGRQNAITNNNLKGELI
jgi:hypothetical protein